MNDKNYEIKETLLCLPKESETDVYHKELNVISWYGKPDKLDIRGLLLYTRLWKTEVHYKAEQIEERRSLAG